MKDITEQIYDELNAQVVRMLDDSMKKTARIVELETENTNLRYELNAALSGGTVSCLPSDTDKLREFVEAVATNYSGLDNQERSCCYGCDADLDDHEPHKPDCIVLRAQAALASTAGEAPVREVPEGWQLVPIEPTRAMWDAESKVDNDAYAGGNLHGASSEQIWHAMLSAAPLPAAPVQTGGE